MRGRALPARRDLRPDAAPGCVGRPHGARLTDVAITCQGEGRAPLTQLRCPHRRVLTSPDAATRPAQDESQRVSALRRAGGRARDADSALATVSLPDRVGAAGL